MQRLWAKLVSNIAAVRSNRAAQLAKEKRARDRALLLEQLNQRINESEIHADSPSKHDDSAVMETEKSRLDDSVLENLNSLLRRGGGEVS